MQVDQPSSGSDRRGPWILMISGSNSDMVFNTGKIESTFSYGENVNLDVWILWHLIQVLAKESVMDSPSCNDTSEHWQWIDIKGCLWISMNFYESVCPKIQKGSPDGSAILRWNLNRPTWTWQRYSKARTPCSGEIALLGAFHWPHW